VPTDDQGGRETRARTTSSFIARAGLPSASDWGGISPATTLPAETTEPYARRDFLKEARIWERRLYPTPPVYSMTDQAIPKFRRWYRQCWVVDGHAIDETTTSKSD
jgi:hypothetical protein